MAILAYIKSLTGRLLDPAPARRAAVAMPARPLVRRHDDESQWRCVASVMRSAIDTAGRARELHETAAMHIDSATYAFGSLLEELSAVMPVTGVEGWGRKASVHTLASARGRALAGAALAA